MATSTLSILSLSCLLFILSHGSLAQLEMVTGGQRSGPWQSERKLSGHQYSQCRVERINTQEPVRRVESEGGYTEFFDERSEQLDCAGVAAIRRVIRPRGLLLPSFFNAPRLVYIVQGRGISGTVMPGCPETFQSFGLSQSRREGSHGRTSFRDQHQRITQFREGDILALPAGVSHWAYNNGDQPIVAVTVYDTSSTANQLDRNRRQFMLAGKKQSGKQFYGVEPTHEEDTGNNVFSGFDTDALAAALDISRELASKLKGENDQRGEMVLVKEGFDVVRPSRSEEERRQDEEWEWERRRGANGLEETFCSMKMRENIEEPTKADIFNPRGGRITKLNSFKLPILRHLQLSASRGILYRNALVAPYWNVNAHSVMYVTRGRARIHIVSDRGSEALNGEVKQGQIVVVPQNFAVLKQASDEGFEWVSFKTNDNAMTSPLSGKTSVLRGVPEDVLASSFQISREEARRVKNSREDEVAILSPRSQSRPYA